MLKANLKILTALIVLSGFSFQSEASTCARLSVSLGNKLVARNITFTNIRTLSCQLSSNEFGQMFDESFGEGSVEIQPTEACIFLVKSKRSMPLVVAVDRVNGFEYSNLSGAGDSQFGMALTSADVTEAGVTRVDVDLETGKARFVKWKFGIFGNKTSHNYSLQCK